MGVDKTQITKNAQRYLLKGQIDLAIAEWERLLAEKKDGNVYNTIGDLHLKKNRLKEAIDAYKNAAVIFKEDGFILKAIALYKKILNLTPKDGDTILELANLNREKGLIIEAIDNMVAAADIYSSEGKVENAIEIYQKALELAPHNVNLRTKIIDLYLKVGLTGEAVREYIELARGYLSRGDLEKAKGYFLNAIEIDKQNIPAIIGLSEVAERYDDIDEAIVYIRNAMSIAPDDSSVSLRYAGLLIRDGRVDEAEGILKGIIQAYPSNTEAKRLLGNIYLKRGLYEKAWEEFKPVIDRYLSEKRWDDAKDILDGLKETTSMDVKQRWVHLYKGMGKRDEAINILKSLADEYERDGRVDEAIQSYRDILELSPDDEIANEGLKRLEKTTGGGTIEETVEPQEVEAKKTEAEFYAKYGFKEQAIKIYEDLLKAFPEDRGLIERLEALKEQIKPPETPAEVPLSEETKGGSSERVVLQAEGDSSLREVIHEFKKGIEKEVGIDDAETHYNLGIGYKEMGLLDEAISEFMVASKDHRKTRQSMIMIALCHIDKGLYESAINVLNKVKTSMSPSDDGYLNVQYELANAYLKNKDYENALRVFNDIKRQEPKFRDVDERIESIQEIILSAKKEEKKEGRRSRVSYL